MKTIAQLQAAPHPSEEADEAVLDAIRRVQYGEVVITIHDGVVVQIDRTERKRLAHPKR
jgi:hypothetical protein